MDTICDSSEKVTKIVKGLNLQTLKGQNELLARGQHELTTELGPEFADLFQLSQVISQRNDIDL